MKIIYDLHGREILVDDWNYDWLNQWTWHINHWGYAVRSENKKCIFMHRVIMNTPQNLEVDHKDANTLNNQECNLRNCTRSQNNMNHNKPGTNTSGYKGVSWDKEHQKWTAHISYQGKHKRLGLFTSSIEAAIKYDSAAMQYYGEFAKLNFPKGN